MPFKSSNNNKTIVKTEKINIKSSNNNKPEIIKETLIVRPKQYGSSCMPLVLVEGFLGPNQSWYWGSLEKRIRLSKYPNRLMIYPKTGSISSLHDRACEVFYQIKGGTVDYGESHSSIYDHNRYGKTYEGAYPKWSAEYPVHLAGHSFGGNTIFVLQQMLHNQCFEGYETSADWVYSLTCFTAPLMGTPLAEVLGASPSKINRITPMGALHLGIVYYDRLKIYKLSDQIYSFEYNCNKSYEPNNKSNNSDRSWIKTQINKLFDPNMRLRSDNGAVDLTPQRMQAINIHSHTFKDTFYRSYTAQLKRTEAIKVTYNLVLDRLKKANSLSMPYGNNNSSNSFDASETKTKAANPFMIPSFLLKHYKLNRKAFNGPLAQIGLNSKNNDTWSLNDGICPTRSMYHPGKCKPMYCTHQAMLDAELDTHKKESNRVRGQWSVIELEECNHRDMFPFGAVGKKDTASDLDDISKKNRIHARVLNDFVSYLNDIEKLSLKRE